MVVVNLLGGLGNQMFQYAAGRALSARLGSDLKLDISAFETYTLRHFALEGYDLRASLASPDDIERLKYRNLGKLHRLIPSFVKRRLLLGQNHYRERSFGFDPAIMQLHGDVYLSGYWQSEHYFSDYADVIRKDFSLKKELTDQAKDALQHIRSVNAISLHVRRGDYITDPKANKVHGVCSLEYYETAVKHLRSQVENGHFFIFSDDLEWAKTNLHFLPNVTFVELTDAPDYEEMYLMSQCRHNIIANSSFSWWGAWLNTHPGKIVIAPLRWFAHDTLDTADLIPGQWIRL